MTGSIRAAAVGDAGRIADIYNHFVRDTIVTFEEQEVDAQAMAGRIRDTLSTSLPWLVAEAPDGVVGYAYAGSWKNRSAYRFAVETTVYLDPGHVGRGIGTALYTRLLSELGSRRMHVAIGGISLPNAASVALHEKLGFSHLGSFSEVGFKLGRWIDVGYWQKLL